MLALALAVVVALIARPGRPTDITAPTAAPA
jgi:hypothetical protein